MMAFDLHKTPLEEDGPKPRCEFAQCRHRARWKIWTPHISRLTCNQHSDPMTYQTYRAELLIQATYVAARMNVYTDVIQGDKMDVNRLYELSAQMNRATQQINELVSSYDTLITLSGGQAKL